MKAIRARFELGEFGVQLLHGVTGSGKTEVYLRAVQETLARGKTALVLVPEIALTLWIGRSAAPGLAHILRAWRCCIRRWATWNERANGGACGTARHASLSERGRRFFAPPGKCRLIIVDEEQENSFKQEETPRYHGRDVAIVRAKMEGALVLLGSATPSMENVSPRAGRKVRIADAGFAGGGPFACERGNR